jgi:hypothetical protein
MSDWETIANRLVGAFGQEEDLEAWREYFDIPVSEVFAADAAANTNTANTKLWSNPFSYPVEIKSVEINASSAITADATNYATITLYRDDGADATPVACAVRDTSATNVAADIDAALTLTVANCVVASGASIFRNYLKASAGVQLPEHALKLRLRRV